MIRWLLIPAGLLLAGCFHTSVTEHVVGDGPCSARFTWFQKDAFQDYPKRLLNLWPPHTSTQLQVGCDEAGEDIGIGAQNNHGTGPDKVVYGIQVLQEMRKIHVRLGETHARELFAAYLECKCDGDYFSMSKLSDKTEELFKVLAQRTKSQLRCAGSNQNQLLAGLKLGKFDAATMMQCGIDTDHDWQPAFDDAMQHLKKPLDSYHVCNNDAKLQAKLIEGFIQTGKVTACNGADAVCKAPMLFYQP